MQYLHSNHIEDDDEFYSKFDEYDYIPMRQYISNNKVEAPSSSVVSTVISNFLNAIANGGDIVSTVSPSFILSGKSVLESNADYLRPTADVLKYVNTCQQLIELTRPC